VNRSEQINELAKALAQVQAVLQPAGFDAVNPYFKSKYASLGSVIETAKVLAEYGLSYSQMPVSDGWYIGVENILMHESGQWISQTLLVPMDADSKNPVQEAGKIITYCRRYGLASMLGIYSDEDCDGNSVHQQTPISQAVKTPQPLSAKSPTGERPYKPETLKSRIAEIAEMMKPANDKQLQLLAAMLSEYFGDDDLRHDAQEYLFGSRSLKDVDRKVINAGLKWLDISTDSGGAYVISDMAKKELSGVQGAVLIEKGQKRMDDVLASKSV
jgi:hypothetical protein